MGDIVEKLISEQNQYDLFYNILLSIKSVNPGVKIDQQNDETLKLESGSIQVNRTGETKISSFYIRMERKEEKHFFSKNIFKYKIWIFGSNHGYSSFNSMEFKSDLMSNRCTKVIGDIFEYLIDIDEKKKTEKTNNLIQDMISDISTTVDKAYRRDNKIDEVLNK